MNDTDWLLASVHRRPNTVNEIEIQLQIYRLNYNSRNPTKGVIINHPNGSDVYKGVLKDYVGKVRFFS